MPPEDAHAARAVGADAAEEITNAFVARRERQRRKKRHSGNGLPNFSETAGRKGRPQRSRATAHSLRDRRASLNGLKSLRRVFTLATCPSTPPRAIYLNCSTESATCKMQRS